MQDMSCKIECSYSAFSTSEDRLQIIYNNYFDDLKEKGYLRGIFQRNCL